MSLGTHEQGMEWMKQQADYLLEQTYHLGFNAGYEEGKGQAWSETVKTYEIEPEKAQEFIEQGRNELYECVKKILKMSLCERSDCFMNDDTLGLEDILCIYDANEIVDIIKTYEGQKKDEEDEIKVGDEIRVGEEYRNAFNVVVCLVGKRQDGIAVYQCISENGMHFTYTSEYNVRKTGRHFPQISDVLNKMKEDTEC